MSLCKRSITIILCCCLSVFTCLSSRDAFAGNSQNICGNSADADVVIMLDVTGSTDSAELQIEKNAAKALLDFFATGITRPRVSIGTFSVRNSGNARILASLTDLYGHDGSPGTRLYRVINRITSTSGATDIKAAIDVAQQELVTHALSLSRYIIVISDGIINRPFTPCSLCGCRENYDLGIAAADAAEAAGTQIFAVHYGEEPGCPNEPGRGIRYLRDYIATTPDFFYEGNANLEGVFERIATEIACDDGDACTRDHCNKRTHTCEYEPIGDDSDGDGVADCSDRCPGADDSHLGDACSAGVGECKQDGELICGQGELVCSVKGSDPQTEICDGRDNDCDGKTDEDFKLGEICTVGTGACETKGVLICDAKGNGTTCSAQPGDPTEEICDGIDNDCDGETDEGFDLGETCSAGEGACENTGTIVCTPDGTSACSAQPGTGTDEVCDGIDNDCDGEIDEGLGLGDSCTVGTGACENTGTKVCADDGTTKCSAEPGTPTDEICDGIDNDCDEQVDEDFNLGDSCTVGDGACENTGSVVCGPDGNPTCSAEPGDPSDEVCDESDNDCDGEVDEGLGLGDSCAVGEGACEATGTLICSDDGGTECSAQPGDPTDEICDGIDNDCDGDIDEGLGLGDSCTEGKGACEATGTVVCGDDGATTCSAEPGTPTDETCDGADNDCDGEVDENFSLGDSCTAGDGACQNNGTVVCSVDGGTECSAHSGEPTDEICDGIDNDCDGDIDEGLGLGDSCSAGTGACQRDGVLICADDGSTKCSAEAGDPSPEHCDGVDNDCDGEIDEDFHLGESCTVGTGACESTGVIVCSRDQGRESLLGEGGGETTCNAAPGEPSTEVCDSIDNDCNGSIDDGIEPTGECSAGTGACEASGQFVCVDGNMVCSATPGEPGTEICDGVDNDCDENIDEGFSVEEICTVGTGACQRDGVLICSDDGGTECSATPGEPSEEVCDGIDNDCDDQTDENVDACGVCGGDNSSCADCNGVPFGTAKVDNCGVCGGTNACVDCKGVAFGTAKLDACGVCGGDGQSCLNCAEVDISDTLFALDGGALAQKGLVDRAAGRLLKVSNSKKTKNLVNSARAEAEQLYLKNWVLTWTKFPRIIKNCQNTTLCVNIDNTGTVSDYNTNAQRFDALVTQLVRQLKKLKGSLSSSDKGILKGSSKLLDENLAASATVPLTRSECQ